MTDRDTGGPAYPACNEANMNDTMGMTLRDWLAGQALLGVGTWMPDYNTDGGRVDALKSLCNPHMLRVRAEWAYAQADAMLKERSK